MPDHGQKRSECLQQIRQMSPNQRGKENGLIRLMKTEVLNENWSVGKCMQLREYSMRNFHFGDQVYKFFF
jgi:hypothetical protein